MPMVDITVNGRRHSVQCGDGEEARVRGLAAYIDRKISELSPTSQQVGDARLMLLASLMVADELSDAYDKIKELEAAAEKLGEYGLRRVLEDILIQEEEHKRDLLTAIES